MKRIKYYILGFLFLGIILFCIYNIVTSQFEYQRGINIYEKISQYINVRDGISNIKEDIIFPEVDFDSLRKVNKNIVGWIYIGNTNISYPIVEGNDNSYYLNHLIDNSFNSVGSIFLDYRNNDNLEDQHSIIYGHHTRNSTMFTELNKYKDQSFFDKQPYYLIITPNKNYKIDIISGYVTDVEADSWKLNFSDGSFNEWINTTIDKSLIKSDIIVESGDKIITLSTCNHDFDNAKFVLVGVINEYVEK